MLRVAVNRARTGLHGLALSELSVISKPWMLSAIAVVLSEDEAQTVRLPCAFVLLGSAAVLACCYPVSPNLEKSVGLDVYG